MRITVDRKAFAQALAEVAPFASQKSPIEILKYAKITTKGDRMKIEANDSQSSIVKYMDTISCDADGSFLVDMADFNKFVARIKGNTIDIEAEGAIVCVKHSKGSAEFTSANPDEYAKFKMPENGYSEIELPSKLLCDAVAKGRNFVSKEKLKPVMCAIFAYVKDGSFGFCASDTVKLINRATPIDVSKDVDMHWFIMESVFPSIIEASKKSDTVKIKITDTHASYRFGDTIIQSVLVKGNYPNFNRVIPKTWSIECCVERLDFTESLGRLSLFCDNSQLVKLSFSQMDLTLSVENLDYQKSSVENIFHKGCDGEIQIGTNIQHTMASIGVFGVGDLILRMTSSDRPILFHSPEDDSLQVIVMPLQLPN